MRYFRAARCFGLRGASLRAPLLALCLALALGVSCSKDPVSSTPTAEFVPASIVFPTTALGDTARVAVSLVSRVGWNQTVSFVVGGSEFSIGGPGAGATLIVQAGRTVDLEARFHPTSEGTKQTGIGVSGAVCPPLSCRGSGKLDPCRVEPKTLAFGQLEPGKERTLGFTVYCDGPDAVSGNVVSTCAVFGVVEGGGPFHLEPGQSLRVEVSYRPTALRDDACEVRLGATWCEAVTCAGRSSHTWRVNADGSGDAPTVQAAIDRASDRDVVLVGPGRYYETINLRGKKIHLLGDRGRDATILDGSRGDDSVVVCESGETNETVIEGFTITGGKGRISGIDGRYGAGVLCLGATPMIHDNTIVGNRAITPPGGNQSRGGGILYELGSNPEASQGLILRGNVIRDNFASYNGGGALLASPCLVEGNEIVNNEAGRDGGGLLLVATRMVVWRNIIARNKAGDHGGGVYIWKGFEPPPPGSTEIAENLIVGNSAWGVDNFVDCSGGAIWVSWGAWIHHNTIIFNDADSRIFPGAGGICLYCSTVQGSLVESNVIYHNTEGGIVAFSLRSDQECAAEVIHNLLFLNDPEDVYNNQPEEFALHLQENILKDPLLCLDKPESNGSVAENSPALSQEWGVVGAVAEPGCGPAATGSKKGMTAWGVIQTRYGP